MSRPEYIVPIALAGQTGYWENTFGSSPLTNGDMPDLSDPLDSTFIACDQNSSVQFLLSTYTILPTERVASYRLIITEGHSRPGGNAFIIDPANPAGSWFSYVTFSRSNNSPFTRYMSQKFTSQSLTQLVLDGLTIKVSSAASQPNGLRVNGCIVELEVRNLPASTPSVTRDTNGKTSVAPRVTWTDPIEPQRGYRLRIFTKAVADTVGFDPAVAVPTYDSGEIASAYTLGEIPFGVLNPLSDYALFNKVAVDFNGTNWWSNWSTRVDFATRDNAAVAISSPTPAQVINTTTTPFVEFTVTDPDDNPSYFTSGIEVKVFDDATYSNPSFAVGTSPVKQSSGKLSPGTVKWKPSMPLANGNYRYYVRAFLGNSGEATPWSYVEFNVNMAMPNGPVGLVATATEENGVEITWTKDGSPGQAMYEPITFAIQKQIDGKWIDMPDPVIGGGRYLVSDKFAAPNRLLEYRVSSRTEYYGTLNSASPQSVSVVRPVKRVAILPATVLGGLQRLQMVTQGQWVEVTTNKDSQVISTLGSSKPKVISGRGDYQTFSMAFLIFGRTDLNKFEALMDYPGALCVLSPKEVRFVALSGQYVVSEYLWDDIRNQAVSENAWKVVVPFLEVDRPEDAV